MVEIDKLREKKQQLGWSFQRIADETERLGCAVSVATVKRLFSAGADLSTFKRYTVDAIVQALGMADELSELDSLRQQLQEKDAKIAALEQQIADTAAYTEGRLDYMKGVDAEKMKLIESQEKNRHELFLDQSKKMRHKDRVIFFLAVLSFIFAAILIYFFVYDTMHPEIGYLHNGLSAFLHGIVNCSVFGVIP